MVFGTFKSAKNAKITNEIPFNNQHHNDALM